MERGVVTVNGKHYQLGKASKDSLLAYVVELLDNVESCDNCDGRGKYFHSENAKIDAFNGPSS